MSFFKVFTRVVAWLCYSSLAVPREDGELHLCHDELSLVQTKATVSSATAVHKEKQMPVDIMGMFGQPQSQSLDSEEMFGGPMFGAPLSTQHLANALGQQDMNYGNPQGQAPVEMFHNVLTTQHLANALGEQDLSGKPGVFMHSQADKAKEQIRQMAMGNHPLDSAPLDFNSAGGTSYQTSPGNFHYQASDSPGFSQLLSMGGSSTGSVEAQQQETEIHSAKLAQQLAAKEATEFAGNEGSKLAHNLMLKDVLDKFYKDTPKAPVTGAGTMLGGSSAAAPSALYSTASNALDESVIQAAVQDVIAKQSLQATEAENSKQKGMDQMQAMLLQKLVDTQELLSKKVLALEEAKRSNNGNEDTSDGEKVAKESRLPKKLDPTMDPLAATLEAEKAMYQADVQANKDMWENSVASERKAYIQNLNDREKAAVQVINAHKDMATFRNNNMLGNPLLLYDGSSLADGGEGMFD